MVEPVATVEADAIPAAAEQAAEEILRRSGVKEGYCVVLGCGRGELAQALAKRSGLRVCGIDPNPENVALARRKLDAAGLYGVRVAVRQGSPSMPPYPRYFANLVVSGQSAIEGVDSELAQAVNRCCAPTAAWRSRASRGE